MNLTCSHEDSKGAVKLHETAVSLLLEVLHSGRVDCSGNKHDIKKLKFTRSALIYKKKPWNCLTFTKLTMKCKYLQSFADVAGKCMKVL